MIKLLDFSKKLFASLLVVISLPTIALAGGHSSGLSPDDTVGVTFWIISIAMVASTVFFLIERDRVSAKWKTSLTVVGLVTLIAAVHYFYMREVWVATGDSPTVLRYIDWLLTVPLQMIEFYLILAAVTAVSISSLLPKDITAQSSSVAGLITFISSLLLGFTHFPSI